MSLFRLAVVLFAACAAPTSSLPVPPATPAPAAAEPSAVESPAVAAEPEPLPPRVVCLVPLGAWDEHLARGVAAGITQLYGFPTRISAHQEMPASAWYEPNRRWRADTLLDELNDHLWPIGDCDIALGITTHDISTTKGDVHDWGIFGLGEIGGFAAVVSSWRLKTASPDKSKLRRLVKVANHEIGHVLGLPHVNQDGCLMHDAEGTIRRVDEATGLLCEAPARFVREQVGLALPALEAFDWAPIEAAARR